MSKRSDVLNLAIATIEAETHTRGYRGFRYAHELNNFPCFCLHPEVEQRIWTDERYGILRCSLRGYTWTDNLDNTETYARQLERALYTLKSRRDLIEEARLVSLRTDEGLMQPYGIVDIGVEFLYRYKND